MRDRLKLFYTRLSAGAGLAVCVVATTPAPAFACKCANTPLAEKIAKAEAIFSARVMSVRIDGRDRFARLQVIRAIKGDVSGEVEVSTRAKPVACGYVFREGMTLTFAGFASPGGYVTNRCFLQGMSRAR